jgi:hypothetical protein
VRENFPFDPFRIWGDFLSAAQGLADLVKKFTFLHICQADFLGGCITLL